MQKQALVFVALVLTSLAACPATSNINNILAGTQESNSDSVTFTVNGNSSVSQQTYNYQYNTQFSSAPSVALAIQNFALNYVGPNSFIVSPQVISTTGNQFQFSFTPAVWSSITINFFVSSNPQLQVGFLSVASLQFGNRSCQGCALTYANLQNAFAQNENPVIRVFLNGFNLDAKSSSLQISVSPINLQNTKLTFKVTLGKTTVINSMALSWIAFSPTTSSFISYGGQINQNQYSGSVSSDISSSIYQSQYTIYGLTLLSILSGKAITFGANIDTNFIITIASSIPIDSFSLVYVALGQLPSKQCSNCGAANIVNSSFCVAECPANTYAFTYKDGGVACRSCSNKLGQILVNGKCIAGSSTTTTTTTTTKIATAPTTPSALPASNTASSTSQAASTSSAASGSSSASSPSSAQSSTVVLNPTNVPAATPSTTISNMQNSSKPAPVVVPNTSITCSANAYFNGNECVCQVGYIFVNGACTTSKSPTSVPVIITYTSNKKACNTSTDASGSTPVTPSVTPSTPSTTPSTPTTPTTPSKSNTSSTVPSTPTTPTTPSITPSTPSNPSNPSNSGTCSANSYDNGLGVCVCNSGYYQSGSTCVQGSQCGVNTVRKADGSCACAAGFTNYNGVCSQCPPGAFYSSASSKCIFVCGQNAVYSSTANSCVCTPGFGLMAGQCQQCPSGYFISNGYCVTCPVNSVYNTNTQSCDCVSGFFTNQFGICTPKCGTNEVYDIKSMSCVCLDGLGRINGACTICPSGTQALADGSGCSTCGPNQILVDGNCACQPGFAINSAQVCIICSNIPNGFLLNGLCSVCPKTTVYDGNGGCKCPDGKVLQGNICTSQCRNDQILDSNGNCYTCGANQVISNGQCVCIRGYSLTSCGVCQLSCASNQFIFQGGCAVCPLNTVYKSEINGCDCPTGYYKDTFGVCQQLVLKPISCNAGQYFDSSKGCITCPGSCKTCSSATVCTACTTTGFAPNGNGVCAPQCGDGLIIGNETCDTGLSYSPGCISCQIQNGYTCSGQPSLCKTNTPTPQPAPTPSPTPTNTTNSSGSGPGINNLKGLFQSGNVNVNSNNVFITLKTNPTFNFPSPTEMQNFLKTSFPSGPKPTVYCSQRASPNLDTFDCLLIYPSGVPNSPFTVNFSYNYQSQSGSTTVSVNPLATTNSRRGQ